MNIDEGVTTGLFVALFLAVGERRNEFRPTLNFPKIDKPCTALTESPYFCSNCIILIL